MKSKILINIFLLGLFYLGVNGQDYMELKPTSNWPYLFKDFQDASIIYKDDVIGKSRINYHLFSRELHFIKDGKVYVVDKANEVKRAVLDKAFVFVRIDDDFYRLLGEEKELLLVELFKGNVEELHEAAGAYGVSTSSGSVKQESSLYTGFTPGVNFKNLEKKKSDGKSFSVKKARYFIKGDQKCNVSKKNLIKLFPGEKAKIEKVIKDNKTKFKNNQDVLVLMRSFQ